MSDAETHGKRPGNPLDEADQTRVCTADDITMSGPDDLRAEYAATIRWASARLRGRAGDLHRIANANPRTFTRDECDLAKAALLYAAARVMAEDL